MFETFAANDEFYLKVVKPLLLSSTVGSTVVKSKIKPVKYKILMKDCNWLQDAKGVVLSGCRRTCGTS